MSVIHSVEYSFINKAGKTQQMQNGKYEQFGITQQSLKSIPVSQ